MATEIIFNAHPSLIGGWIAWNHIESETDKHLIIAEGNTFEELAVSARAGVALTWASKPGSAPLVICLRQAAGAPEAGIMLAKILEHGRKDRAAAMEVVSAALGALESITWLSPQEERWLTGLLYGAREDAAWNTTRDPVNFFDLKGMVETLLEGLGIPEVTFTPAGLPEYLRYGARVFSGSRELENSNLCCRAAT